MGTRKRFEVEIPEGQHLGLSHDTEGALRAHLFDDETNTLVGHAELFETEETSSDHVEAPFDYEYGTSRSQVERDEDLDELAELLGNLLALAIIAAATRLAPHVRRLWTEKVVVAVKAVPTKLQAAPAAAKATWTKVRRGRAAPNGSVELAAVRRPTSDVNVVLDELRVTMTSAEARERFAAALVAQAFADEQMRLLSAAHIEDGAEARKLESALAAITPEQVATTITLMLAQNSSLLGRDSLTEIGEAINETHPDRGRLALPRANVEAVLRMSDGQP